MRSELVFQAKQKVQNRYELTRMTALATRNLHTTDTTVAETINNVLASLAKVEAKKTEQVTVTSARSGNPAILVIVSAAKTAATLNSEPATQPPRPA